jgi:hypothetical protein
MTRLVYGLKVRDDMEEDMTRDEKCGACYFFVQSPTGVHGFCKRNPPVFTGADENGRAKFFNPVVSPHSFCGEFEEV